MKANHNVTAIVQWAVLTVSYGSKILKWKQITTVCAIMFSMVNCFLWFKDTKMKANHNGMGWYAGVSGTVSYGSKILKWKQITTNGVPHFHNLNCFLWFKDTKMKANHNNPVYGEMRRKTVSYGSKILKWKQITTKGFAPSRTVTLFPMVQRY